MDKIDISIASVTSHIAHLRHVHGCDYPDAVRMELLVDRLAEMDREQDVIYAETKKREDDFARKIGFYQSRAEDAEAERDAARAALKEAVGLLAGTRKLDWVDLCGGDLVSFGHQLADSIDAFLAKHGGTNDQPE